MSTKIEHFPEHSPLGASAAERWMSCPGSNVILKQLHLPHSDESEFAAEGTAAHEAAAHCLRNSLEAWEIVGQEFHKHKVTDEMAEGVQFYLDALAEVRKDHDAENLEEFVEHGISADFNPLFYGTVDSAMVSGQLLDVSDLKFGAGIAVDAENNPQLMYYAYGIMLKFGGSFNRVRLRIIQPRAFHPEGPVREWETTSDALYEWANKQLKPAMARAEFDTKLEPGDWCRFCPAKLVCPLLVGLFGACQTADASVLPNVTSESLGRDLKLVDAVKHYCRAVENEVLARLSKGSPVVGFKLVPKKSNRVLKPEGIAKAPALFGEEAYEPKTLKSPAGLDKLTGGKKFTAEYAFTPHTGLTVAPDDDKRVGVKIEGPAQAFAGIKEEAAS